MEIQETGRSMNVWMGQMDGETDGQTRVRQTEVRTNGLTDGQTAVQTREQQKYACINGLMNKHMDRQTVV